MSAETLRPQAPKGRGASKILRAALFGDRVKPKENF